MACTVVIRRSPGGVHSGQIAFPGGKCEKSDTDLWCTACREAYEEVGIRSAHVEMLTELTGVYVPPSNFLIHPFLAIQRKPQCFTPDAREVEDYKNIPLKIFNPASAVSMDISRKGVSLPVPAWEYEGYVIWGATAMILSELHYLIATGGLKRV